MPHPIPAHGGGSAFDIISMALHTGCMDAESEKSLWVDGFPRGESDKDILGRLVDEDHDDAETELYESFADPTYVATETAQRRYRGMFGRRIRHMRGSPRKP